MDIFKANPFEWKQEPSSDLVSFDDDTERGVAAALQLLENIMDIYKNDLEEAGGHDGAIAGMSWETVLVIVFASVVILGLLVLLDQPNTNLGALLSLAPPGCFGFDLQNSPEENLSKLIGPVTVHWRLLGRLWLNM